MSDLDTPSPPLAAAADAADDVVHAIQGGEPDGPGGPDETEGAAAGDARGARLFDQRRMVHPPLIAAALLLGGATPTGRLVGVALILAGLTVRLWACRHMGGAARVHARKARKHRPLVVGGPFRHVRHPLYLANASMLAGACLLLGPAWFAIVAFETTLLWYRSVAEWEERLQERKHPIAWPRYAATVRGWWPRMRPMRRDELGAAAALETVTDATVYGWRQVMRRERGALVTALVLMALPLLRGLVVGA